MITVYLLNNTTQKYKYNNIGYKDYGEFVQNVVKQIKWYIFSIDNIIITINDEEIKLNEVDLNDNINSNDMSKIDIYERKRDTHGNVCESNLVDNFLKWNQYREDCQFAKDLEQSMNGNSNLNYLNNIVRIYNTSLPPLPGSSPQPSSPPQTNQLTDSMSDQVTDSNSDTELEATSQFYEGVFPNLINPTINSTTPPNSTTPSTLISNINNLPPFTLPPPTVDFLEFVRRLPPYPQTIPQPIQPPRPTQLSQQILTTFIENIGAINTDYSLTPDELEVMTDVKVVLDDDDLAKCRKCTFKDIKDDGEINIVEKCNFTLEEFKNDSEVLCLPCGHYFMSAEITEWLTEHSHKCPICRKEAGKGNVL